MTAVAELPCEVRAEAGGLRRENGETESLSGNNTTLEHQVCNSCHGAVLQDQRKKSGRRGGTGKDRDRI
jgi:hypothetical protein